MKLMFKLSICFIISLIILSAPSVADAFYAEKTVVSNEEPDFSSVYWSAENLQYNGTLQSVSIHGLPKNVTLESYTDASFTDAGEYTAVAKLVYDTASGSHEKEIKHKWRINPIEYEMSDFTFSGGKITYDGEVHYPDIKGEIPIGLDGSTPAYSFSGGVRNVAEGVKEITVSFVSTSKNYKAPESISVNIEIVPKPITVFWSNSLFAYSGEEHKPTATASECSVTVIGGAVDAGIYTANAKADDINYIVSNPDFDFVIQKVYNFWIKEPTVSDVFEGKTPMPTAEAHRGEVVFNFYRDIELNEQVAPIEVGKYYMTAYVPESKNYFELSYVVLSFEIIKVVPVEFCVEFLTPEINAMRPLTESDISAYYINNDNSKTEILFSDIKIQYQNGSFPQKKDTYIKFGTDKFEIKKEVSVSSGIYDMSGVYWSETTFVYDGEYKFSELLGLPEGVTVSEYICNSAKDAGVYELSALLEYDKENYKEPILPQANLIIKKQIIILPDIPSALYNGKILSPEIAESDLYTFTAEESKNAGTYKVNFSLKDENNYEFLDNVSEKDFTVLPRELTVKIEKDGVFTVESGSIIEGDSLSERFYTDNGYIYIEVDNPNYKVTVLPAKENAMGLPLWGVILILIVLLLSMGGYIAFANKRKLLAVFGAIKMKIGERRAASGSSYSKREGKRVKEAPVLETLLAVDESHANTLISDFLAKNLITDLKTPIKTKGRRRSVINIDTISENFSPNDTVDINALKSKGLIPSDAKYVKVLSRGIIDKPINVIANSFSLSAVKMIALTGGTARRAHTSNK